jgi:hypothetical protein
MDSRLRTPRHTKECRLILWGSIIAAFTVYSVIMLVLSQVAP